MSVLYGNTWYSQNDHQNLQNNYQNSSHSQQTSFNSYPIPLIQIHDPIPFASQIEFVDRAIDNLAKSGKLYPYGGGQRQNYSVRYNNGNTFNQQHIADQQRTLQQQQRISNQRVVSQPIHLPSMNHEAQYQQNHASPGMVDNFNNGSSTSTSSSDPSPTLPTTSWPPQRAASVSVSGTRSISPKLKFDPFAPVSSGPEIRPQSVSPEVVGSNSVSFGPFSSGGDSGSSRTLDFTSKTNSTLGWSKVWGKPTGLTATSVWG